MASGGGTPPDVARETAQRARAWSDDDPDAVTQAELARALAAGDVEALTRAAGSELEFGTAGLRGEVGPGPARMNVLQVTRFAWALGTFLSQRRAPAERGIVLGRIVLGHDARRDSARFARAIEVILAGQGWTIWASTEPVPTPLVAFAVRDLGALAGVVVTASHNPKGDNGVKLYDSEGIQIVSPWDTEIQALMTQCPPAATLARRSGAAFPLEPVARSRYVAQVQAQAAFGAAPIVQRKPRLAYTALHGVGKSYVEEVLSGSGVELHVVPSQAEPDPDFPSVPFPNPEEPGALDALLALAEEVQADAALATDPDADRAALALPDAAGKFHPLSGDELGLLLADQLLGPQPKADVACISSIVSSPAVSELAKKRGARAVRTLTGFKWLARAAAAEPEFALAYEEALGYCFPSPPGHVAPLDKDGIATVARIAAMLRQAGSGAALVERLFSLSVEIGLWVTHAASLRLDGPGAGERAREAMTHLRSAPPQSLGGRAVTAARDYLVGAETRPATLGQADLLELELGAGLRVLVRPSGTEPKVKVYTHLAGEPPSDANAYFTRREELRAEAARVTAEMIERLLDTS